MNFGERQPDHDLNLQLQALSYAKTPSEPTIACHQEFDEFVQCYPDVESLRVYPRYVCGLRGHCDFPLADSPIAISARSRESVSPQTTRALCRAKEETSEGYRFSSLHTGPTRPIVRMAQCPYGRQDRYVDPLASKGLSMLLEVEFWFFIPGNPLRWVTVYSRFICP
jgi:hypothetical protein